MKDPVSFPLSFPSWTLLAIQAAVLVSVTVNSTVTDVICVGMTICALRGPAWALSSLSLLVVIRYFNPALVHNGTISSSLSWAFPLIVSIRVLPLMRIVDLRLVGPLWLFCIVAIVCSIIASPALAVSVMKAVSLAVIAAAVLVASLRLTSRETAALGDWLCALALVVAALSLASLARPGVAYFPGTNLLRGVLNQSQALGTFLAPFTAAYLTAWLCRSKAVDRHVYLTLALIGTCMLLTFSRTAAIASVLGTGFSLLGGRASSARVTRSKNQRVAILVLSLVCLFGVLEFAGSKFSGSVSGFVLKRGGQDIGTAFAASRGNGMLSQLTNFASSPLVGHGFGVYANGYFPSGVVTVAGIPVSAPVEKGVVPTAVLEETGLLGFSSFAYLVFSLTRTVWRRAPRTIVAILFSCLFVNLGEAVLLSPGGMGLFVWLLIGWCLRHGAQDLVLATTQAANVPVSNRKRYYANLLD